jgi:hypothetical protein
MHRLVDEIKSVEDDMNERDFVNFWSSYKLLIEQLQSKGRKNAHYDLMNYLELMNDQEDAWDISARWIEEDKDENPERYVPDHLKDLPEDKIETLRKIHKPRWRKNG